MARGWWADEEVEGEPDDEMQLFFDELNRVSADVVFIATQFASASDVYGPIVLKDD